jgi:hypothetical protein
VEPHFHIGEIFPFGMPVFPLLLWSFSPHGWNHADLDLKGSTWSNDQSKELSFVAHELIAVLSLKERVRVHFEWHGWVLVHDRIASRVQDNEDSTLGGVDAVAEFLIFFWKRWLNNKFHSKQDHQVIRQTQKHDVDIQMVVRVIKVHGMREQKSPLTSISTKGFPEFVMILLD